MVSGSLAHGAWCQSSHSSQHIHRTSLIVEFFLLTLHGLLWQSSSTFFVSSSCNVSKSAICLENKVLGLPLFFYVLKFNHFSVGRKTTRNDFFKENNESHLPWHSYVLKFSILLWAGKLTIIFFVFKLGFSLLKLNFVYCDPTDDVT